MHELDGTPVFIVGAHRSGTTLLRTMLAGHPSLLVHRDEPQFILGLARRYGQTLDRDSGIAFILAHPYHEPSVTREGLVSRLPPGPITLRSLARTYLDEWQVAAGYSGTRLVLKHPHLVFQLDLVLDLFPGAVIVNMVRDPRANIASQLARWPRMSLWTAVSWWRGALHAADRFRQGNPTRVISIRYEDLVLAPEDAMLSLCRWLEIPYSRSLLTFDMTTKAYELSSRGEAEPVHYCRPEPSRLRQWRENMDPSSVRLIEWLCRIEMSQRQYQPVKPRVPAVAVAKRAAIESAQWGYARTINLVERVRQLRSQ